MDDPDRFFGPFGANEMFVSALVGWGVQVSGKARAGFLDAVERTSGTSSEPEELLAAVAALRDAKDFVVTVEPFAAVGNIDLAMFSREHNAVLLVEHKTGSSLSRWQLSKYRLAMRAADPLGERKLGTILLRASAAAEKDREMDPPGFDVSCKLDHKEHMPRVFAAIAQELDGLGLGDRIVRAALRHAIPSSLDRERVTDNRQALFDQLEAEVPATGWSVRSRAPLSMNLTHPATGAGHLHLTVGPDEGNMLWGQFRETPTRLRGHSPDAEPQHLFDLWAGKRSVTFPTPFPVHHSEKPWLGDRPEDRSRQVRIAVALLSILPDHVDFSS